MNCNKLKALSVIILLFTTACGSYTTVRQSPEFSQEKVRRSEIIVLPTEAIVNTVDFGGNKERMYDYESHIEGQFSDSLTSTLRNNGYTAKRLSMRDIHDKGIAGQVLKVRQRYTSARDEMYKSYVLPEEEAFAINKNVGKPEINFKTGRTDNLLLFSDYIADVKTSGARTKDVLIDALLGSRTAQSADVGKIVVSIIDNNSGSILWSNLYTDVKDAYSGAFERIYSSDEDIDKKRADTLARNVLNKLIQAK